MKFSLNSTYTIILATLSGAVLTACGGGQSSGNAPVAAATAPVAQTGPTVAAAPAVQTEIAAPAAQTEIAAPAESLDAGDAAPSSTPSYAPEATAATAGLLSYSLMTSPSAPAQIAPVSIITEVKFQSTAAAGVVQSSVPVTFGQVFAVGHLLPSNSLIGRLADGTTIPLQMDIKASHPDGSVRHAIISAVLPTLASGETRTIGIAKQAALSMVAASSTASLLSAGFTSAVNLTLDNQTYSASADELLKTTAYKTWLAGAATSEWVFSAPLKTASGAVHPHLSARFALRWYSAAKKARVDVTIENDWAYEAAPQNFTYDAQVLVGGKSVYEKAALTHYHHARWRKVFWWGEAPQVHIRHNTSYLINSRALPNFDQSTVISEASLAALSKAWTGARIEPMGSGAAMAAMPTTGARNDIGLLPGWAASYLLSMDKRAKDVMLGTADLAGSWSSHYRDRVTDRPVSIKDYPYMTIYGNVGDTYNKLTKKYESFPVCVKTVCTTPLVHDMAHQPNFAYLPYLVTGDYYYLEEMQFWGMYNLFQANPAYREYSKGVIHQTQVRGQAWMMRSLGETAYITPDQDPLKAQFDTFVSNNLDWYNTKFSNNPEANALGINLEGAVVYTNGTGVAPWQDDFFTSAIGHVLELGFTKAAPLLAYKAKFPIARMTTADACWIDGAIYSMIIRDSATSPVYATMGQAYRASHTAAFNALACNSVEMASSLKLKVGEMTGYSTNIDGFPSDMQPALAYSADVGGAPGRAAWAQFMARTVKPNYGISPQFAIVPR